MATKEDRIRSVLHNIGKLSGVESVVLADENGFPLSATVSQQLAESISALITSLKSKINVTMRELELDELKAISLKTETKEVIITSYDSGTLVVIRNSNSS